MGRGATGDGGPSGADGSALGEDGGVREETPPSIVPEDPERFPEGVRAAAGGEDSWLRLRSFAEVLEGEGELRGLIGPRELPRLWSRHIVNSMAVNDFVPPGACVADVGSGAGFPGVVLAITRPDVSVTLIDAMERRCDWLRHVVEELDLRNASVVMARVESLSDDVRYEVVTARAVAPLERLGRWTLPLVETGGALLALKGERAAEEVADSLAALRKLGATGAVVNDVVSPLDGGVTRVVEIRMGAAGSRKRRGERRQA